MDNININGLLVDGTQRAVATSPPKWTQIWATIFSQAHYPVLTASHLRQKEAHVEFWNCEPHLFFHMLATRELTSISSVDAQELKVVDIIKFQASTSHLTSLGPCTHIGLFFLRKLKRSSSIWKVDICPFSSACNSISDLSSSFLIEDRIIIFLLIHMDVGLLLILVQVACNLSLLAGNSIIFFSPCLKSRFSYALVLLPKVL